MATPPASISFSDQWEKAGLSEKLEEAADTLIPTVEANEICQFPLPSVWELCDSISIIP